MDKGHERRPLLKLDLAHVLVLHLPTAGRWKAFPPEYGASITGAPVLVGTWC